MMSRFADCVEHGDVGRGHADDASGIPFEYLTGEIFGSGFAVTGDEQARGDAVGPLPRVCDGEQDAFLTFCSLYVKARSVFGGISRTAEIGESGTFVMTACEYQYKQQQQAKIFPHFLIVIDLDLRIFSCFSRISE